MFVYRLLIGCCLDLIVVVLVVVCCCAFGVVMINYVCGMLLAVYCLSVVDLCICFLCLCIGVLALFVCVQYVVIGCLWVGNLLRIAVFVFVRWRLIVLGVSAWIVVI